METQRSVSALVIVTEKSVAVAGIEHRLLTLSPVLKPQDSFPSKDIFGSSIPEVLGDAKSLYLVHREERCKFYPVFLC